MSPYIKALLYSMIIIILAVGSFLLILFFPGTKFADGYSPERFSSLQVGMYRKDVHQILGAPLVVDNTFVDIETMPFSTERYTEPRASWSSNFYDVYVNYGLDGRVRGFIVTDDSQTYFYDGKVVDSRFWSIGK